MFPLHIKYFCFYFVPLQHIFKRLSVSVRALLCSLVRRTLALRGPAVALFSGKWRDCVAEWRRMTQMKYGRTVRERAERNSLITAQIYDGYVSSLALWVSGRRRVASVCFRGARRDATARRARASTRLPRRIHPALPPSSTRLFLGCFGFFFVSPLLLH